MPPGDEPIGLPPLPQVEGDDESLNDAGGPEPYPGAYQDGSQGPPGSPGLPFNGQPGYPHPAPPPADFARYGASPSTRPPPMYAQALDRGAVQYIVHWSDAGRWAELGTVPANASAGDLVRKWGKHGSFKLTPIDMDFSEVLPPKVIDIAPDHEAFKLAQAAAVAGSSPTAAAALAGAGPGSIPPEVWALIQQVRQEAADERDRIMDQVRTREVQVADKEHEVNKILANLSIKNTDDVLGTHEKLIAAQSAREARASEIREQAEARLREKEQEIHAAEGKRTESFFAAMMTQQTQSYERERQREADRRDDERKRDDERRREEDKKDDARKAEERAQRDRDEARRIAAEAERARNHDAEMERIRSHNAAMIALVRQQSEAANPVSGLAKQIEEILPLRELLEDMKGDREPDEPWWKPLLEGVVAIAGKALAGANQPGEYGPPIVEQGPRQIQVRQAAPNPAAPNGAPGGPSANPNNPAAAPTNGPTPGNTSNTGGRTLPADVQKTARAALSAMVQRLENEPDQAKWDGIVGAAWLLSPDKAAIEAYVRAVSISAALVEAEASPGTLATLMLKIERSPLFPHDIPR